MLALLSLLSAAAAFPQGIFSGVVTPTNCDSYMMIVGRSFMSAQYNCDTPNFVTGWWEENTSTNPKRAVFHYTFGSTGIPAESLFAIWEEHTDGSFEIAVGTSYPADFSSGISHVVATPASLNQATDGFWTGDLSANPSTQMCKQNVLWYQPFFLSQSYDCVEAGNNMAIVGTSVPVSATPYDTIDPFYVASFSGVSYSTPDIVAKVILSHTTSPSETLTLVTNPGNTASPPTSYPATLSDAGTFKTALVRSDSVLFEGAWIGTETIDTGSGTPITCDISFITFGSTYIAQLQGCSETLSQLLFVGTVSSEAENEVKISYSLGVDPTTPTRCTFETQGSSTLFLYCGAPNGAAPADAQSAVAVLELHQDPDYDPKVWVEYNKKLFNGASAIAPTFFALVVAILALLF